MIYIVVTLILMYLIGMALAVCVFAATATKKISEKEKLTND